MVETSSCFNVNESFGDIHGMTLEKYRELIVFLICDCMHPKIGDEGVNGEVWSWEPVVLRPVIIGHL